MDFLCGSCSRKHNLSLEKRIEMSKRVKYGSNQCSECENVVIGRVKPIRKKEETIQLGLFHVFSSRDSL